MASRTSRAKPRKRPLIKNARDIVFFRGRVLDRLPGKKRFFDISRAKPLARKLIKAGFKTRLLIVPGGFGEVAIYTQPRITLEKLKTLQAR